jgi:hypothetical protein
MSTLQLERTDVNPAKSQKKKASSEKFDQTLSSRRKMTRTLPLGNSQEGEEEEEEE